MQLVGRTVAFFSAMLTDLIKLEEELDEFLHDFGFQAVDLQTGTHGRSRTFRLFLDRVDGQPVTISDCSSLAPQIKLFLEMKKFYNDQSSLEVSSAGLDRVLKRDRDYELFLGREVKVSYFTGNEKHTLMGELSSFTDDILVVTTSGEENQPSSQQIPRSALRRVNLVPSMESK
jgi:ribosome maturation factor RimP